jgi:F0F1-type ATP synthase membrane subunit c/vacuolar-type H+-ATPase subunit K
MNEPKPNLVAQYQTLVVLWAALLMAQLLFLVVLFFTKKELFEFRFDQPIEAQSGAMILGFAVVAITCVGFSFAFKKRFLERAIAEQKTEQVQSGLIIAIALCEAASLIGLCLAFAFDYQYFFAWFILGIAGTLLHFPRQSDLLAAGYKR